MNWAKKHATSLIAFFSIFILFTVISYCQLDPDFGWHLQSGNYYLAHGSIPTHDIFTYTAPNFPWYNHEWLSDVIYALLFHIGGFGLLIIFFAVLTASAFLIASRKHDPYTIIITYVSLAGMLLVRPTIWSLFFFVIVEYILERKNQKWYATLPLIMLIWANFHGGFLIGLLFIIFYKVIERVPIAWPTVIASFAATFVNPFGPNIYVEIFRTVFDSKLHARISEWNSFSLPSFFTISAVILFAIFFATNQHKKLTPAAILRLTLLGIAWMSSLRYFLFFMIGFLRYFEAGLIDLRKRVTEKYGKLTMYYFFISLTLSIVIIMGYYMVNERSPFPTQIAAYLVEHPCPGNVFNEYNFGGYLIWKVPGEKIFIDGRMPSWRESGVDYFDLYWNTIISKKAQAATFEKYNIQCVVYSDPSDFVSYLQRNKWVSIVSEPGITLLEKK